MSHKPAPAHVTWSCANYIAPFDGNWANRTAATDFDFKGIDRTITTNWKIGWSICACFFKVELYRLVTTSFDTICVKTHVCFTPFKRSIASRIAMIRGVSSYRSIYFLCFLRSRCITRHHFSGIRLNETLVSHRGVISSHQQLKWLTFSWCFAKLQH